MDDSKKDNLEIGLSPERRNSDKKLNFLFGRLDRLDGLEDGKICKGKIRVWFRVTYFPFYQSQQIGSHLKTLDALKKWVRSYVNKYLEETEGYSIRRREWEKILDDADINEDGFIDIREFKGLVANFMEKMTKKEFR